MDNFDLNRPAPKEVDDEPIPFDDAAAPPPNKPGISHSPLNLGGPSKTPPAAAQPPRPGAVNPTAAQPRPVQPVQPRPQAIQQGPVQPAAATERVTGVRTFFTKLHEGAIDFLDQQISDWLKKNPDIKIKFTNTIFGDMTGKKTEPSIIITVWY
jgi:hypothetical protein